MENAGSSRRQPPQTETELMVRARALCGHTVAELAQALQTPLPAESRRAKGFVGQLVEAALGADRYAGERPDFPQLGIELKTIPVDRRGRSAESTFVCSINFGRTETETWECSRFRQRILCVLWLPVQCAKEAALGERRFGQACLWRPTSSELESLRQDWEYLIGAIGAGQLARLTARAGRYLQVRPKAAHARVTRWAPGEDAPQKDLPVGFYLRAQFTAAILGRLTQVAGGENQ
jgi:DNA mismatch repair protein MutH